MINGATWRGEWSAFIGFMERQKNLYRRYWAWEVVWSVYALVTVMSIGYLAAGVNDLSFNGTHFSVKQAQLYLLIGALLWSYLSHVFFEVAFAICWERWEGTIEYTFMAPVCRATHLLGIAAFGLLYGMARSAFVLIIIVWAFALDLSHADLAAAGVIFIASTPPLLGIGILASTFPLLSPEKGEQMNFAVQGLLLLVSGVYYPLSVLPAPLYALGIISPLTYTLASIREALLGQAHVQDVLPTAALLIAAGAIVVPFALWVFGRAEARAKRLGLLKRSG